MRQPSLFLGKWGWDSLDGGRLLETTLTQLRPAPHPETEDPVAQAGEKGAGPAVESPGAKHQPIGRHVVRQLLRSGHKTRANALSAMAGSHRQVVNMNDPLRMREGILLVLVHRGEEIAHRLFRYFSQKDVHSRFGQLFLEEGSQFRLIAAGLEVIRFGGRV